LIMKPPWRQTKPVKFGRFESDEQVSLRFIDMFERSYECCSIP
jgi:hypothetical protein